MAAEQFVTSFLAGDGGQRFNITKSQTDDFMMKNILEIEAYVKRKKAVELYEAGKWEAVKTSLREEIHKEAHKFSPRYLVTLPTREFRSTDPSGGDDNIDDITASTSTRRKRRTMSMSMEHDDDDDVDCPICLDADVSSEFKILPCAHVYHQTCLSEWLGSANGQGDCPSCRRCIRCHGLRADIVFRFFDVKPSYAPIPVLPNKLNNGARFGKGDITIDDNGNNNHPGGGNISNNNGTQSNQGNPRPHYDRLQFLD